MPLNSVRSDGRTATPKSHRRASEFLHTFLTFPFSFLSFLKGSFLGFIAKNKSHLHLQLQKVSSGPEVNTCGFFSAVTAIN